MKFVLCSFLTFVALGSSALAADSTLVCMGKDYTTKSGKLAGQDVVNLYKNVNGVPTTRLATLNCEVVDNGRVTHWSCESAANISAPGYSVSITSGSAPNGGTGTTAKISSEGTILADNVPCFSKPPTSAP